MNKTTDHHNAVILQLILLYFSEKQVNYELIRFFSWIIFSFFLGTWRTDFQRVILMVLVGASKFGKTNLIFDDPGVKINGT